MDTASVVFALAVFGCLSLVVASQGFFNWMQTSGRPPRWYFHIHHTRTRKAVRVPGDDFTYQQFHCRCGAWRWDSVRWIDPFPWPTTRRRRP